MSEHTLDLVFEDLEPIRLRTKIGKTLYIITEATAGAAAKWRSEVLKAIKPNAEGKPTAYAGMAEVEPHLVSLCTYFANENGELRLKANGEPDPKYLVSVDVIKTWKSKTLKSVFKTITEMSDLDDASQETPEALEKQICELQKKLNKKLAGDEGPAKNEPSGTSATSS